jgi:hypothetical protein
MSSFRREGDVGWKDLVFLSEVGARHGLLN